MKTKTMKPRWKIPMASTKTCEKCGCVSDIFDLLNAVQEPRKRDEFGKPEDKVKCPGCGDVTDWAVKHSMN